METLTKQCKQWLKNVNPDKTVQALIKQCNHW